MSTDDLLLLQAHRPASEDSEVLSLLERLAHATGAHWVQLDLAINGAADLRTFTHGTATPPGVTLRVDVDSVLEAVLRLGIDRSVGPEMSSLLVLTVETSLRALFLSRQNLLLRGALDTSSSALLLFDGSGDIVYANPGADRLLSRQTEHGLCVEEAGSGPTPLFTLLCSLVERISHRPSTDPSWQGTLALSDGSAVACEVTQVVTPASWQPPPVVAILETANAVPDRCIGAFVARFNLSPREEQVVRLLHEGLSTGDVARRLNISLHTVRDHIKHLYRKTETSSRGELFTLLAKATFAPPA